GGQDASERIDNVGELEAALVAYAPHAAEPSIAGFLQETALLSDVDGWKQGADRLTLMTLHAAKGLEFEAVFMVGMEEGLLPHARALDDGDELEEERRLAYVGMTRARRHLLLSFAGRRATFGAWGPTIPSRFLDEIPPERVEHVERRGWSAPSRGGRPGGQRVSEERVRTPDPDDELDFGGGEAGTVPRPGCTVRHAHFGQGVVVDVRGAGPSARITVRFEVFGDRQLVAEYARLEQVF
ncbi:MAG TPA: 3'-5' exonuclease, partial [Planctomycetota bacterium]|nr:3'-5' exonuclease [Planctomycetota bacterium]